MLTTVSEKFYVHKSYRNRILISFPVAPLVVEEGLIVVKVTMAKEGGKPSLIVMPGPWQPK